MSDVLDVQNSLVALVAGAVYPNGTGQPSVSGSPIVVYAGWPTSSRLDADLLVGKAHITVFPSGNERNTTRYAPKAQVMSIVASTITLTAIGKKITVGGAMPSPFTPHNLAIIVGNRPFIYSVQSTDTLPTIASGLAALLAPSYPGVAAVGPVITMPATSPAVIARVGTTGQVTTEWERQCESFQVTVWAADPTTRKAIGSAIKVAFSKITFMTMPDGFGARVKYTKNILLDAYQKAKLYRHDLFYEVEYATTSTEQIATVVAGEVTVETMYGTPITTKTY